LILSVQFDSLCPVFDSLCQVGRAAEDSNNFPPPGWDQDEEATDPQDCTIGQQDSAIDPQDLAIDLSSTSSLSDENMSLEQDMEASMSSLSHVRDHEALANVDDEDSEITWDRERCFKEKMQRSTAPTASVTPSPAAMGRRDDREEEDMNFLEANQNSLVERPDEPRGSLSEDIVHQRLQEMAVTLKSLGIQDRRFKGNMQRSTAPTASVTPSPAAMGRHGAREEDMNFLEANRNSLVERPDEPRGSLSEDIVHQRLQEMAVGEGRADADDSTVESSDDHKESSDDLFEQRISVADGNAHESVSTSMLPQTCDFLDASDVNGNAHESVSTSMLPQTCDFLYASFWMPRMSTGMLMNWCRRLCCPKLATSREGSMQDCK
jgi:hypothetical protein